MSEPTTGSAYFGLFRAISAYFALFRHPEKIFFAAMLVIQLAERRDGFG